MGSGASMYKTPEEALAAGVSQADIDKFLKENPNALKPPENAVQASRAVSNRVSWLITQMV